MSRNTAGAIPIPENWDDLTDDQKDEVSAALLESLADQIGVDRGSVPGTVGGRSRAPRSFKRSS